MISPPIYQGCRARNEDNLNLNLIDFRPPKDAKYDKIDSRSQSNLLLEQLRIKYS